MKKSKNCTVLNNGDVVVFGSRAKMEYYAQRAIELGVPYVQFHLVFCEGAFIEIGDSGPDGGDIPMTPVFLSFGSYENIFMIDRIFEHRDQPLDFSNIEAQEDHEGWDDDDWDETKKNLILFFDLKKCFKAPKLAVAIPNLVHIANSQYDYRTHYKYEELPGSLDVAKKYSPGFHVDTKGKSCFNETEAKYMSDLVMNTRFVQQILSQLNEIDLEFAQRDLQSTNFYCNETVYGETTLISVSGLLYLPVTESNEFPSSLYVDMDEKEEGEEQVDDDKEREKQEERGIKRLQRYIDEVIEEQEKGESNAKHVKPQEKPQENPVATTKREEIFIWENEAPIPEFFEHYLMLPKEDYKLVFRTPLKNHKKPIQ